MSSFETIAEQAQLAAVTEFVHKAARSASFSETDLLAVDLIAEEIFLNIAMHGYQDKPGRGRFAVRHPSLDNSVPRLGERI